MCCLSSDSPLAGPPPALVPEAPSGAHRLGSLRVWPASGLRKEGPGSWCAAPACTTGLSASLYPLSQSPIGRGTPGGLRGGLASLVPTLGGAEGATEGLSGDLPWGVPMLEVPGGLRGDRLCGVLRVGAGEPGECASLRLALPRPCALLRSSLRLPELRRRARDPPGAGEGFPGLPRVYRGATGGVKKR